MDNNTVGRSKLFRDTYLPGGIIKLRNGTLAQVVATHSNNAESNGIDKSQLHEVASRFFEEWESNSDGIVEEGLKQNLKRNDIQVVCPTNLLVKAFPILLRCNKCHKLDYFRGYDEGRLRVAMFRAIKKDIRRIKCTETGCTGHFIQHQVVAVHRCGHVDRIDLPFETLKEGRFSIDDHSRSISDSRVINMATNTAINMIYQTHCKACKTMFGDIDGVQKKATLASGGESFFVQNVQYVCLRPENSQLITHLRERGAIEQDVAEGLASVLIQTIPYHSIHDRLKELLGKKEQDDGSRRKMEESLINARKTLAGAQQMLDGAPDNSMFVTLVDLAKKHLEDLLKEQALAQGCFSEVRAHFHNVSKIALLSQSRRSYEAAFIRNDVDELSISDYLNIIKDPDTRLTSAQKWSDIQREYHVHSISHISNLNMVLAALGYTRELREPYNSPADSIPLKLCGFQDILNQTNKQQNTVYAMSAETEGIIIKLKASRVLKWLSQSMNCYIPDDSILSSEIKSHAFLLENFPILTKDPRQIQQEDQDCAIEDVAPFHLLHTVAHALMATAKRHTGYNINSLQEYMLPADLSFIIYVTSVQNYTAGGLLGLFKHYLYEWFNDANNDLLNCLMDPVCSEEGAACPSCVQQVIGCETFNHGVSRAYLHRGFVSKDKHVCNVGFWD